MSTIISLIILVLLVGIVLLVSYGVLLLRRQLRPFKVLVADDDDVSRNVYCEKLAKSGYRVTGFNTLDADYISQIIKFNPDLILLDINHPGPDGTEMFEEIHKDKRTRSIPFVFFTNSPSSTHKISVLNHSPDVIVKSKTAPYELVTKLEPYRMWGRFGRYFRQPEIE